MYPLDSYPLIEVPFLLRTALEAVLPAPPEPQPIAYPTCPGAPTVFTVGNGIFLAGIILGGLVLLDLRSAVLALLLTLSGIICLIARQRYAARRYARTVARYQADCHYYQTYPALLVAFHQAVVAHKHPATVANYRAQQVAALLARVNLPIYSLDEDHPAPARGRSEAYFLAYLTQHFGPDTIWANCCVPVDDPRLLTAWYYPDFIYRDASGLCINIEIDEPYALRSHQPIHYRGQDEARNAFFLRQNWVVIRFTEEQVVRYPALCCKELAQLIYALNQQHYPVKFLYDALPRQPRWDRQQAQHWATAQSRHRYLSLIGSAGLVSA